VLIWWWNGEWHWIEARVLCSPCRQVAQWQWLVEVHWWLNVGADLIFSAYLVGGLSGCTGLEWQEVGYSPFHAGFTVTVEG